VDNVDNTDPCAVIHTRTWTAEDDCGNFTTAIEEITVVDVTPPTISALPAPSTINCPATPVFTTPTATDDCGTPTLSFVDNVDNTDPCAVIHTRTWTAEDDCGNITTAIEEITVVDVTPPTISALPAASTINCPAVPVFTTPTASDDCGTVTLTFTDNVDNSDPCAVVHTRTWTATDNCGNTATASEQITVVDVLPPTISTLPAASVINCPATPAFTTPTATDDCGNVTLTFADNVDNTDPCAVIHTRIWTATDNCGNTATASEQITVVDVLPPTISTLPAASVINCPATPAFTIPTATDDCGTPTLSFVDNVDNTDPCAVVHTRTWTAEDDCGNITTAIEEITMVDVTPPTISTLPAPSTINCPATPVFTTPTATDDCGTPTLSFVDNVDNTDPCAVIHTRTWTAEDDCGNFTTAIEEITVVDVTPPTISALPAHPPSTARQHPPSPPRRPVMTAAPSP
jgi:hypothetical protein